MGWIHGGGGPPMGITTNFVTMHCQQTLMSMLSDFSLTGKYKTNFSKLLVGLFTRTVTGDNLLALQRCQIVATVVA